MTERMEHFDEDLDLKASTKLSADLSALFEPQRPVPPEVDRAVLDHARRHFVTIRFSDRSFAGAQDACAPTPKRHRRGARRFRWAAVWKVAAAAAVVIFAFSLDLTKRPEPTGNRSTLAKAQAIDIDQNGRVDILDAFTLARNIESAGPTKKNWDINGDGKVNRDDVDVVAFAAVRLDKGVL